MLLNARKVDVHDKDDPMILLAIEDITEKRSIESAVEKERKIILENIPSGLMILDKKWRFTYCNKKTESIIGKNLINIAGRNIWKILPEWVGSPFDKYCRKAMKTGNLSLSNSSSLTLIPGLTSRLFHQPRVCQYILMILRNIKRAKK